MEIRPFRGWRYKLGRDHDLSRLIAPPYDILSAQDKADLLSRSPRNIVAVDLPHVPPSDVGPPAEYRQAAATLADWCKQGFLVQEPKPAMYIYEQMFTWAGKTLSRVALICGVRAGELGRDVIPHEHTMPGPKADRLRLAEQTKMQLSPIFGFFNDPGDVRHAMVAVTKREVPDAIGRLKGVYEKLWVVQDADLCRSLAEALRDEPVFIADGHHRYTTQLDYRNALAAQNGPLPPEHEANFVMFALVAKDDIGMLILPTHRIVSGLKSDFSVAALARATGEFNWHQAALRESELADAGAFLARIGRGEMALMDSAGETWVAGLSDSEAMAKAAPGECEAWRTLDVAVLHKLIIDKALAPWRTPQTKVEYTPDAKAVTQALKAGKAQLGVLLQPTPIEAVEQIARAGAFMPPKSTYFFPKLSAGMVIKPLA